MHPCIRPAWRSGELGVGIDHAQLAAPLDDHRQFPSHPPSGDRHVGDRTQALLGDIIDDVEVAEAPGIGKLVVDELQRQVCIRLSFTTRIGARFPSPSRGRRL